jgi:hypothetical protein
LGHDGRRGLTNSQQTILEQQRDGSTCMLITPMSYLKLNLHLTPVQGLKVNDFTITMDVQLEQLPWSR